MIIIVYRLTDSGFEAKKRKSVNFSTVNRLKCFLGAFSVNREPILNKNGFSMQTLENTFMKSKTRATFVGVTNHSLREMMFGCWPNRSRICISSEQSLPPRSINLTANWAPVDRWTHLWHTEKLPRPNSSQISYSCSNAVVLPDPDKP